MNILLPVGISFYTFQAIGYTIDVYRKTILPEKNFFTYALFVSFFPQLVAGPIERAKNLLPQFHSKHIFNQEKALEGLKLMIWGYFMKLCIAERLSPYVDAVYNNYHQHNGTSLLLATFFFTFQIFCDFGGYSLIAIGAAKCMNFELMQNFNRPYFAINIKQFWRKWHISLSTWFMDYVYIPLGGNRCKTTKHLKNLFVTFFVSGLWHGANWTFIAWGSLHGIYLIVGILKNKYLPKVKAPSVIHTIVNVIVTFCLVMFAWIFFRANDITSAFAIIKKIFTEPGALYNGDGLPNQLLGLLCIGILMMKELKDEMNLKINFMHNENVVISTVSMAAMVSFILLTAVYTGGQFIYFQF
ncbi:MAG: MBOAT family O-acyltransferase [Barnesiella sp.]